MAAEVYFMISFLGIYAKTMFRDEKTGYTVFAVSTDDKNIPRNEFGNIVCCGKIIHYPVGIPLRISGEFAESAKGETRLTVISCAPESKTAAAGISFLSGPLFPGIGLKKAEKIVEAAGGDLFSFCRTEDAAGIISKAGTVSLQEAENIKGKVNEYSVMQDLFTWITQYGGSCEDAERIYDEYGEGSVEKIKENPYYGGLYGLNYATREAVGKQKHIAAHDKKRLRALVNEAFRVAESAGSTCIALKTLFALCRRIEERANMGYRTVPICIAAFIWEHKDDYVIVRSDSGIRIYRKQFYEEETKAVMHIRRLMQSKKEKRTGSVKKVEDLIGISYNEQQKQAVQLAGESGIVLLTGGPGTGKSTAVRGMIAYFRQLEPEGKIALCAPTGSAAKRMRELTGEDAETIHRMMDVRPFDNGMLACRDEDNQLPYDMIIADEFSMADIEMFMMLLSGIKNGALLVLTGDENQLPSVGPGNVFHDLIRSSAFPSCRLTKVYRQKGGSSILENAARIRMGDVDLIRDESTEIIYVDTDEEAEKKILDIMSEEYSGKNMRLYTPVKNPAYRIGKTNMNRMIRGIRQKNPGKELVYDGTVFSEGDPIIMCRNNYRTGYMNGDEGVVWKVNETTGGDRSLEVNIDGELITIAGTDLEDIDLAYALTTHRSQGSECDISVIVVPEKPSGMLIRSLIYVAATRAREKNIFVVQGRDSLNRAIITDSRPWRTTGLTEFILGKAAPVRRR